MKTTLTATLAATLAAVVLMAAPGFTAAQTSSASDAKPAKPTAKSAKKKPAANNNRTNLKTAAKNVAAGIEAAEAARASVTLTQDEKSAGYFDVQGKNFKYRMFPVATTTGAIRLEDQKAGAVWLQLANKSMLMNQKQGIRLADECMSPAQVAIAESMKSNPPASVLDAPKAAVGKDAPAK
jgi:hypothetical protein